jgi:phosphohistidine swiveling domain-containing protein
LVGEPDAAGRAACGQGENVVRRPANVIGIARYVRSSERVIEFMNKGVPPGSIAIIDDSGGTLTAPILEHFAGIVCAGGTIRSHLGILAREYGIPCLMNARIRSIRDGDRVELETSAEAMTAEAYFTGAAKTASIWKLAP